MVRQARTEGDVPAEDGRSEEHTSELQSHLNLVCRLLLEKKKKEREQAQLVRLLPVTTALGIAIDSHTEQLYLETQPTALERVSISSADMLRPKTLPQVT